MKFGLDETVIEKLTKVFEDNPKVDKAYIFGSRAKGNYRPDSDIDIAVKGYAITLDDLLKMSVAFEDAGITNKIDLLDYNEIKEPALVEHIDRVGVEFYSRWKEYAFSDFLLINPTVSLKSNKEYSFVEMKDLHDGNKYCFPSDKRRPSGGARFQNGDTLFARITPCLENGKINQVAGLENGIGFGSTEFLVFRGKPKVSDNDFVFYLSRWDEVRGFAEGHFEGTSGRQRVPKNSFDALKLDLPPLLEQIVIATILNSLDEKVDLLHRQNNTLEQLAETLFRQWFVEEAEESWEEKSLVEIADYLNGLALQKFPSIGIGSLPVIKIREMKQGITENTERCSDKIPSQFIVHNGDVLFSWSGSLEVVLWTGGDGALNQHLFKVSSTSYPKWFYYLATKHHLDNFKTIAESKSTTMGHIQREHLKQAMISIPPLTLFDHYDKGISPLINKQIENHNQIQSLTKMRDTLLPKLMNGEVRVAI